MARNIIIFVADGLRPGSVNATDTPTLYSVRQNGVNFTDSHSLFPTFTTPNASAIAAGHYLGNTEDFNNTVYTDYPVINANGTVTLFIENDPILADINANSCHCESRGRKSYFDLVKLDSEALLQAVHLFCEVLLTEITS